MRNNFTQMRMLITTFAVMSALAVPGTARAVDHIRGQVVDILTGKPIQDAYVICPITENVTRTDARGVYSLTSKFIERKRNMPGGLTGLLTGGPLALFGVGSGSAKALDPSPKPLLVLASGYKLFYGNVDVLTGDVGKASVVVHRIGLAPDTGDLISQEVAGAAGLGSRGSTPTSQSGQEGAFSVKPLGYVTEVTLEPIIVSKPSQAVDVVVRMDGPPELLTSYRSQVMFSTGHSKKLTPEKADKMALNTSFKARVQLPANRGIVEAKVGGAFVIRVFEHTRGFLDIFQADFITSFLANLVRAVGNTGADYAMSVVAGNLVARNFYLASLPDTADAELPHWQRGLRGLTEAGLLDERLSGLPASPTRDVLATLTQYALAGDNMVKLRDWVTGTEAAMVSAPQSEYGHLISRGIAVARFALAKQSGLPEEREAAFKAIESAASGLSKYGPGFRQLADLAYGLENYSLAQRLYAGAAKHLGDVDRELGDPTAYISYGPSNALNTVLNWFNPNDLIRIMIGGPIGNVRKVYSRRAASTMAEACKRLAKAQKTNSSKDWIAAAEVLRETGDLNGAIRCVERANSVKETAEGFNTLGVLNSKLPASDANIETQLRAYHRACELNPKDPVYLSNLARTLWETKQYEEAAAVYERIRVPKDEPNIGFAKTAVLAWKNAGDDPDANETAALLLVLEDATNLDRDATQPIAIAAANKAAAANRAWAHWALYRLTQDPDHLDNALTAMPNEPLFHAERMESYLGAGDLDHAEEAAAKARSLRRQRLIIPKDMPSQARRTLVDEHRERLLHLADGLERYGKLVARRK